MMKCSWIKLKGVSARKNSGMEIEHNKQREYDKKKKYKGQRFWKETKKIVRKNKMVSGGTCKEKQNT